MRAVTIGAVDPDAMAARWAKVPGLPRDGPCIPLDGENSRFEPVDSDVLIGVEIAKRGTPDAETVNVGGVVVALVPHHE